MECDTRDKSLFENDHSVMLLIDPATGRIRDANQAAIRYYGWSRSRLKSKRISDINCLPKNEVHREMKEAKQRKRSHFLFKHRLACGDVRDVEVYSGPIVINGEDLLYSIVHDITRRRLIEKQLEESRNKYRELVETLRPTTYLLEAEVKKRTLELENINTALKVLLEKRDEDKKEFEERIYANHELLITPFLEKLRAGLTENSQKVLLDILTTNLGELLHPFSKKLSDPLTALSPREIQVANMVKNGMSTKEIAAVQNCAIRTVTNHRDNIRKKLGLVNKKVNLRSYLSTL
ncbi:MAG: LuxR C-terminal-related transcriptional regulator [Desulfobacterales bacterium]|nr:LuxR C-terminal-related transcriptional regulator [Desulfobacterales bacterium]